MGRRAAKVARLSTTTEAHEGSRGHLLQVLGVAFGLAVLVGNTIGMGILRTPGEVAAAVPSAPVFMALWVVGAAYALLGALSVAELAAMRPRSGGLFPLVHHGLGPFAGFVAGWADWLGTCGSMAAVAFVLGEYVGPLVPALGDRAVLTASVLVVALALLQWRGIRVGDAVQQVTSLIKAVALIGLAVIALVAGSEPSVAAALPASGAANAAGGLALVAAVVVGLQSVIYTYDGWTGPVYFGEEVRDPGRDIPRSMIGGVLLVMGIYLALNFAFLRVIPIEQMAGDPFVAASVAERLFGPAGDTVVRVLTVVSLLAAANALQLMASRVPYAMSRERLLPALLQRVNPGGTPVPALVVSTVLVLAFIASGALDRILALLAFFFVANYALTFTALFATRQRHPDTPRPFRVPGYPWVPGVALAGSLAFLGAAIWSDRTNSLIAAALVAVSWPVYRGARRRQ
jgi:APA family basic amino acid/polyamine antiporter